MSPLCKALQDGRRIGIIDGLNIAAQLVIATDPAAACKIAAEVRRRLDGETARVDAEDAELDKEKP